MNSQVFVDQAKAAGALPADAAPPAPTPAVGIMLMSYFGAWLAVLPFVVALAFLGHKFFFTMPGSLLLGAALLTAAVAGTRASASLFVTQLSGVALLLGLGLVGFSFISGMQLRQTGLWLMLPLLLVLSLLIPLHWVRLFLGVAAGAVAIIVGFSNDLFSAAISGWPNAPILACVWAAAVLYEQRLAGSTLARRSAWLDAMLTGLAIALLLSAFQNAGSVLSGFWLQFSQSGHRTGSAELTGAGLARMFELSPRSIIGAVLTLGSFALLALRWRLAPASREFSLVLVCYLVLLVAVFFARDKGVVAVVGTAAALTGRKRILAFCVICALASLSGFYYALDWTLGKKAGLLVIMGVFLGLFVLAFKRGAVGAVGALARSAAAPGLKWALPLVLASGVGTLAAVNWDVMRKEQVIAQGRKIYLATAPRDPRSLLQGDYMRMNFDMSAIRWGLSQEREGLKDRPTHAVAKVDEKGVAQVVRAAREREPLASDELLLPIKWQSNMPTIVTDAYFFQEGAGKDYENARFGEFRVLPDGRALLVGLADEKFKPKGKSLLLP